MLYRIRVFAVKKSIGHYIGRRPLSAIRSLRLEGQASGHSEMAQGPSTERGGLTWFSSAQSHTLASPPQLGIVILTAVSPSRGLKSPGRRLLRVL